MNRKQNFIDYCNIKHNLLYDYSKVNFINNLTPVIIICRKHGEFTILPKTHKNGSGCRFCNQGIRTKEELLIDFNIKHNNKYTYNLSNYKTTSSKIQIFCPEHGNFEQQVNKHLDGHGCRLCGNKKISEIKKKDINKLINEFNEIHNNKYDYSKINFVNYRTKVIITCKEHGDFSILPINHKNGSDCPKCNTKYKSLNLKQIVFKFKDLYGNKFKYPKLSKLYKNKQSKIIVKCPIHGEREQTVMLHCSCGCRICSQNQNQDDLINDFKFIHGDKYDYSNVKYTFSTKPIKIICKIHGGFFQKASNHKQGQGCIKCYQESLNERNQLPLKKWIIDAKKYHKNKYNYDLVKNTYKNAHEKVEIICPKHGSFWQVAKVHRYGSGCPKCAKQGFDLNQPGILYYILIDRKYYKIGITNKTLKERFRQDFNRIEVIKEWYYDDGEECYNMEQYYHKEFSWAKAKDINFLYNGGNTELYRFDVFNLDYN